MIGQNSDLIVRLGGRPIFPPSPKPLRRVFGARGIPPLTVGSPGDIATDPVAGKVYVKTTTGWIFWRQGVAPFSGSVQSADVLIQQSDPLFANVWDHEGSFFALTARRDAATAFNIRLAWTYPKFADCPLIPLVPGPDATTVVEQIVLQRSTNRRSTPFSVTGDGTTNPDGLDAVGYSAVPADPDWTTLINKTPQYQVAVSRFSGPNPHDYPSIGFPANYTDTDPLDHIFNYRVIAILSIGSNHYELDWNVTTLIKPYHFTNPAPYVDGNGLHLHWQ